MIRIVGPHGDVEKRSGLVTTGKTVNRLDKGRAWRSGISIQRMVRSRMKRVSFLLRRLSLLVLALLVFQACNALNPLCGSARPTPIIGSLSTNTITFAQVQQSFALTVNGSQFVSASVGLINGVAQSTSVISSTQLKITITTTAISAPGTAKVQVQTPSGNSGSLGCTSGGTSQALVLTIT